MTVVPHKPGGWWHDYVCPTHGIELGDRDGDDFLGACGCRLTGAVFEAAWHALEHQIVARRARMHAHRYRVAGRPADHDAAVAILLAYAERYEEFVAQGWSSQSESWMLRGKMFAQALSEAQWAVGIADAVIALSPSEKLAETGSVTQMLESITDTLDDARRTLVDERGDQRNNYTAWLDAALRLVALARTSLGGPDPEPRLEAAVHEHMRLAVHPDGWEWEASTYYHVFVLRAYLLALRGTDPAALPDDIAQTLRAMVDVLVLIAAPDGALPILHDGPYDRVPMHREVLEICRLAAQLFVRTGLDDVEAEARRRLAGADDGLEDTLDGWFGGAPSDLAPASARTHFFADAGYVVLRDDGGRLTAVLDAGPHGGAHGHFDKLALYLYGDGARWQPAPGVPPYASSLRHGYYARTIAHPTVMVEGADQQEATATVSRWDATRHTVAATSTDAIDGVDLHRAVALADGILLDVVRVRVRDGAPRDIRVQFRPAVEFDVRVDGAQWRTVWAAPDGATLTGTHRATEPARLVARPGRGPSDAPATLFTVGDWEARTADIHFISAYRIDGPGPIDIVEAVPGHDRLTVSLDAGTVSPIPFEVTL